MLSNGRKRRKSGKQSTHSLLLMVLSAHDCRSTGRSRITSRSKYLYLPFPVTVASTPCWPYRPARVEQRAHWTVSVG